MTKHSQKENYRSQQRCDSGKVNPIRLFVNHLRLKCATLEGAACSQRDVSVAERDHSKIEDNKFDTGSLIHLLLAAADEYFDLFSADVVRECGRFMGAALALNCRMEDLVAGKDAYYAVTEKFMLDVTSALLAHNCHHFEQCLQLCSRLTSATSRSKPSSDASSNNLKHRSSI